jgi:UDP-N-acetylmuramoyl-L-alanyl-D-glutamate--2,6-diaminopimelate ligase
MYSLNSELDEEVVNNLISQIADDLNNCNLQIDSRKINQQSIFCAYPGTNSDGRDYILDAINKGAKYIVWEDGIDFKYLVKNYAVKNLKQYVGILAATILDHPSCRMKVVGVTGTNGKTSITHWLNQVYSALNFKTGIIGTTGVGIYPQTNDYNSTTPDPITLQTILNQFSYNNVNLVAMEVSSHALDQGRVNGVNFETAIFTNLTQDHLDYHHNMAEYFAAKKKLFFWQQLKKIIINLDDEYGKDLYQELITKVNTTIITYGIDEGEVTASNIQMSIDGMKFELNYNQQSVNCQVKAIGKFNVYNLLAVASTLIADGYSLSIISQVLALVTPVKGRMQTIVNDNRPLVVVDFAHTPDSLQKALLTLKEIEHSGKLYCVFGCGGNRDTLKRSIMGKIASQLADFVIVTSDNPRFENPMAIIEQITSGVVNSNYITIENRTDAILHSLKIAQKNDIILIAGKGHEKYQEIKGIKYDFSDVSIVNDFIQQSINI